MKTFAKSCLTVLTLALLTASAQAARMQRFEVELNNESLIVRGMAYEKGSDFVIENIQIQLDSDERLYSLATGQAWGARALDELCEQITEGKNPYSYVGDNALDVDRSPNDNIIVLVPNEFKGGDVKQIVRGNRGDTHLYLKNLICTRHVQESYQ